MSTTLAGTSQVWGGIRLVPLVREEPITDLRLCRELFADELVGVEAGRGTVHTSYIPHVVCRERTAG